MTDKNSDERLNELVKMQESIKDYTAKMFLLNMQAFFKYQKDLYNQFASYKAVHPFSFFCLENGVINLEFTDTHEIFYKCENPLEYCSAQVDEFVKTKTHYTQHYPDGDAFGQIFVRYLNESLRLLYYKLFDDFGDEAKNTIRKGGDIYTISQKKYDNTIAHCLVLGLGLGYILQMLYERVEIANLTVIEPNADLFYASLHVFDYAPLLEFLAQNNLKINFIVGKSSADTMSDLYKIYLKNGKFLAGFTKTFVHYASDDVKSISAHLKHYHDSIYSMLGYFDDHLFGVSQGITNFVNKHSFVKDVPLAKDLKSLPVFVIGNGPSLDADIPFLRKNQDKALIVACGTALDTLLNAGIMPDFYAGLERVSTVYKTLEFMDREVLNKIILLSTDVVHERTVEFFKDTALFIKNDEPLYEILQREETSHDFLQSLKAVTYVNPLVGNLGVSTMLYLGFDKIYLFGLDNGKKLGLENMHSKHSLIYSDKGLGYTDKFGAYRSKVIGSDMVEGNFGGEVESPYFFRQSIKALEYAYDEIGRAKNIKCINCSDGARIKGFMPQKSDKLDFRNLPVIDKEAFHKKFMERMTVKGHFSKEYFKTLFDKTLFNDFVESLMTQVKESRLKSRLDVIKLLCNLSSYLDSHMTGKTFIPARLMQGTLQYFFIVINETMECFDDDTVALDLVREILDCFVYFLLDSKKLYCHMPDYVMEKHLVFFDGKLGWDHEKSKAVALDNIYKAYQSHTGKLETGSVKFTKRYE